MSSSSKTHLITDFQHVVGLALTTASADQTSAEFDTLGYTEFVWMVVCGSLGGGSIVSRCQHSDTSGSGYVNVTGGSQAMAAATTYLIPVSLTRDTSKRYHRILYDQTGSTNMTVYIHAFGVPGSALAVAMPFTAGSGITVLAEI